MRDNCERTYHIKSPTNQRPTNWAVSCRRSGSKEAPGWLRVLLVEDEILQATMLRVLLLDRGLLVVHAQNLRQALGVVEQPIAAAILDITLAEANVYPVAERLRAKGIPFFFFASGTEA